MSTHPSPRLRSIGRAAAGAATIVVAAARAGAAPLSGAQDTAGLTLIVGVFPDREAAAQAVDTILAPPRASSVESYAVVSEDPSGSVTVELRGEKMNDSLGTNPAGTAVAGAIALLGHTVTGDDTAGYAAGRDAGIAPADVDAIERVLSPGASAVIVVVPTAWAGDMDRVMRRADARYVLRAPLRAVP
ncbi:MAG: hypothetical protein IRY91_08090 [Gemmatimonadaceae bacterium]|nr:hypothetical protein [Gemmatimonadaceae bacterium]